MSRWSFAFVYVTLLACGSAVSQVQKSQLRLPDEFLIGRRTFFDFGPPFEFYEVFAVRSQGDGASIERFTLTPGGDACTVPATFQVTSVSIKESVADLLGRTNPCAIPEKDLKRELKRCKNYVTFSGADVTMQVECRDRTRRIRMDILDRDMFDKSPKTPQHTSWTMTLLGRLDATVGDTVMDRPAFTLAEPPAPSKKDLNAAASIGDLSQGRFDGLFERGSHKPSELFRDAQNPPPPPTVKLSSSSPYRPIFYTLPKYPPLARLTRTAGLVTFTLEIRQDGSTASLHFLSGHVLLQKAIEVVASSWTFPAEAAGTQIKAAIDFMLNCPSVRQ